MSSQQLRSTPTFPILYVAGLLVLASAFLLSGCSESYSGSLTGTQAVSLSANWQLSSNSPSAVKLPALSGEISGTSRNATALFHSDSATACATPSVVASVAGGTNASGLMSLSGPYAGGILIITGTPSSDGKSLANATYTVSGGSCGFISSDTPASASANEVATVNGTYAGTFTDLYGNNIAVTTQLSQSAPDANGNFVLSGYATVPDNGGCFTSPTNVQSAQVTGQQFNVTYMDPNTGNSLTTTGTVSLDAQTLTIGSWTVTGPCAGENGNGGTLTRQQ